MRERAGKLLTHGAHPAALAMLAPPAALGGIIAVMALAALVGVHPLWSSERLTMSEAVALRDLGALAELLNAGQDPHMRYDVRAEVVRPQRMRLTPFEAAIAMRRDDVVRFLGEKGVRPSAEALQGLICLASREKAADVLAALDSSNITVDCEGMAYAW